MSYTDPSGFAASFAGLFFTPFSANTVGAGSPFLYQNLQFDQQRREDRCKYQGQCGFNQGDGTPVGPGVSLGSFLFTDSAQLEAALNGTGQHQVELTEASLESGFNAILVFDHLFDPRVVYDADLTSLFDARRRLAGFLGVSPFDRPYAALAEVREAMIARQGISLLSDVAIFASVPPVVETGRVAASASAVSVARFANSGLRLPRAVGASVNITTRSRIKESSFAVRLADKLSGAAQRDVDNLLAQLRAGNANPGIGTRALSGGFFELRGRNAGRVIVKQTSSGAFDIVGKFQGHVRGDAANSTTIQKLISDYGNF